jgi:hypothetical protein
MKVHDSLALLVLLGACEPDLPDGWEDAVAVDDFTQDDCDDTGGDPPDLETTVTASEDEPGLRVVGNNVQFRCAQDVEGFYQRSGEAVDVLVQPVDMNPESVLKCDCYYRIEAGIPEEPPATVSLYRRWDLHGQHDGETTLPVLLGTVEVP